MRSIARQLALPIIVSVVGCFLVFAGVSAWRDTYDPGREVNPLSAVPVSGADLEGASACAQDVIGAEIRQGMVPSRSKLFYTEWRCQIVANEGRKAKS